MHEFSLFQATLLHMLLIGLKKAISICVRQARNIDMQLHQISDRQMPGNHPETPRAFIIQEPEAPPVLLDLNQDIPGTQIPMKNALAMHAPDFVAQGPQKQALGRA